MFFKVRPLVHCTYVCSGDGGNVVYTWRSLRATESVGGGHVVEATVVALVTGFCMLTQINASVGPWEVTQVMSDTCGH